VVAIVLLVTAAAAMRLYQLDGQPGGLYPDEAAEGLDAYRLLHWPGYHPVFFADDAGREALYGYLVAIAFRVAGESIVVLRATSAVLGVLAVVAVYGWLRREGTAVALGAAAWVAGALWLVCISRDGMRNILVPVTCALALWAMSAWAVRPGRGRALLAGAAMGLGLWTYQPLKLLPLLLVAWLLWLRSRDRGRWTALKGDVGWLAAAYLVVGAPMLLTAVIQPGLYFGRAVGVSVAEQHTGLGALADHSARTLLMFALTGDPNGRHNVGAMPLLNLPLALLAALGAWRAWRHRDQPLASLVLIAVPVFLFPPLIATADAAPHFLRSLGLAAPLAALLGMGCAEVLEMSLEGTLRPLPGVLLAGVFLVSGAQSAVAYFGRSPADRAAPYTFNLVQLADSAREPGMTVVLIDDYQSLVVRYLDVEGVANHTVRIAEPVAGLGPPQHEAGAPCAVVALTVSDIRRAYGDGIAGSASVVAVDPVGRPSVWRAAC
jgi:4-amino-4-deoxy-L-arabinose transferase-like glycosyltransferase